MTYREYLSTLVYDVFVCSFVLLVFVIGLDVWKKGIVSSVVNLSAVVWTTGMTGFLAACFPPARTNRSDWTSVFFVGCTALVVAGLMYAQIGGRDVYTFLLPLTAGISVAAIGFCMIRSSTYETE